MNIAPEPKINAKIKLNIRTLTLFVKILKNIGYPAVIFPEISID